MNTSQDQMARRAAEMLRDGLADSIRGAISQARREPGGGDGDPPSIEQVRRHVEAMEMARLGMESWEDNRRARIEEVDQFLATLEFYLPDVELRIAGRAARGDIDEGGRIHVRVWIEGKSDSIMPIIEAADLGPVEFGSRKVDPAVASGIRRLTTLLIPGEHVEFMVSLCPVKEIATVARNLVTGSDIPLADVDRVRSLLGSSSR